MVSKSCCVTWCSLNKLPWHRHPLSLLLCFFVALLYDFLLWIPPISFNWTKSTGWRKWDTEKKPTSCTPEINAVPSDHHPSLNYRFREKREPCEKDDASYLTFCPCSPTLIVLYGGQFFQKSWLTRAAGMIHFTYPSPPWRSADTKSRVNKAARFHTITSAFVPSVSRAHDERRSEKRWRFLAFFVTVFFILSRDKRYQVSGRTERSCDDAQARCNISEIVQRLSESLLFKKSVATRTCLVRWKSTILELLVQDRR